MRFARGSVQRLAAAVLVSFQAKLLVVEDILASAQQAPADDAANSLFVHHTRTTTVDDDAKKAKTGRTSTILAPAAMSSSIAPLPKIAKPPFQQTTADVGILFPAVSSRRSSTASSSSTTSSWTPLQSVMAFQYHEAVDAAGNLFSSHTSTEGKKMNDIETRSSAPLLPTATPSSYQVTDVGVLMISNEIANTLEGKSTMDREDPSSIAMLSPTSVVASMMTSSSSSVQAMICENGYIECYNGMTDWYEFNGTWYSVTFCRDACDGHCCNSSEDYSPGYRACDQFTGKVCKDGSCSGEFACYLANIPLVVNSCIGNGACCEKFGYEGKVSNSVINSCQGEFACQLIGGRFQEDGGGAVDNVIDSCIGDGACVGLGFSGSFCGDAISSCNGYNACFDLGYEGTVNGLNNSCNGVLACVMMAKDGSVGNVENACNARGACHAAGSVYCIEYDANHNCLKHDEEGGDIGDLIDSCNENYACRDTAGATATPTISSEPSFAPTLNPTYAPTNKPTRQPTRKPTNKPTNLPTSKPSTKKPALPTKLPTGRPSTKKPILPTRKPSKLPTKKPVVW